jgi:hypothetical protein
VLKKFHGANVLRLRAGDVVEITRDAGDWWTGMLAGTSDEGLFPSNYVKKAPRDVKSLVKESGLAGPWTTLLQLARVVYDFVPSEKVKQGFKGTNVLNLDCGDLMEVTDANSDWWSGILQATHTQHTKGAHTTEFAFGVPPAPSWLARRTAFSAHMSPL